MRAAAFYKLPIQLETLRAIIARFLENADSTRAIARNWKMPIQLFGKCQLNSLLCAPPRIGTIFARSASFCINIAKNQEGSLKIPTELEEKCRLTVLHALRVALDKTESKSN